MNIKQERVLTMIKSSFRKDLANRGYMLLEPIRRQNLFITSSSSKGLVLKYTKVLLNQSTSFEKSKIIFI